MKSEMIEAQIADLDVPEAAAHAIKIGFEDFRTFLKDFSANLAPEGMFVEAAKPQPPGTEVAIELILGDGHTLLEGRGVVAWSRSAAGKAETAAQGIRFLDLDPKSERLVRRIVEERTKAGLELFDLDQEASGGSDRSSKVNPAGPGTSAGVGSEHDAAESKSLRAEIEKLKRAQSKEKMAWQAELDAARAAEADLNSRLSDSLSRVVTVSESRDALADKFRFAEDSHRRDRRRLEELEADRTKLEQEVEEQKSEVVRWTEEAVAASTGFEALESQKGLLEQEIEAVRGKAEKSASAVEEAQATLSAETSAKETLEKELHETKAALEKLETEGDAAQTALGESLEQARADLEKSTAKAGEFENEVESLRSELGEIQEEFEAVQSEMAPIRAELEQLKSHHDEMKSQAAKQQEAATRAAKLVERVRAEHSSLQDELLEAETALGKAADPNQHLAGEPEPADELEDVRPEVFTPPPPQADPDELPEADNGTPSKRRGRFAGLAQKLLGGRRDGEPSDQFLHVSASEDPVPEVESDDFELAACESDQTNPQLPERA